MPLPGTRAPGLHTAEWLDGQVSLADGTYLLDFWQSGCVRCLDRLEQLEQLHTEHPELEAVTVHSPELDLGLDAVEKVAEKLGLTHHIAHDSTGEVAESYGAHSSHGTFLVHDGRVEWQKTPGNSFDQLPDKVEELTGSPGDLELEERNTEDHRLGYAHGPVNGDVNFRGEREFSMPGKFIEGRLYLGGRWHREEGRLESRGGELGRYQKASRAGVVASAPGIKDIEVTMDGEPVSHGFAGDDLRIEDGRSYVRVNEKRLYDLISGQSRRFELRLSPEQGARLYRLSFC